MNSLKGHRVFVAGHRGMVGAALVRALAPTEAQLLTQTSEELDLRNQAATEEYFRSERPEVVFFAAARVGGIHANSAYPADFLYDNLSMAVSAIHAAYSYGCERFVYLGSTCIYPRLAPQPMVESALLSGPLEPTNEAYALAKIAGLKMCQFYRRQYGVVFHSLMPTNLYGPGDNYHTENSHVLPAILRRVHEAHEADEETVTIWGSGEALREFLHVDDLAAAALHVASLDDPPDVVNVGSGEEVSIRQLAEMIAETVGFTGRIETDRSRPDGPPRKLADSSLLRSTGWKPQIVLRDGLAHTYEDFLEHRRNGLLRSK